MTEYKQLCNIRNSILTTYGMITNYASWSDAFKLKELSNNVRELSKHKVDINELTMREMKNLGFSRWDNKSKLMLIPLWIYPLLFDDIKTTTINNELIYSKAEIDLDVRFGCLAYGIYPKIKKKF